MLKMLKISAGSVAILLATVFNPANANELASQDTPIIAQAADQSITVVDTTQCLLLIMGA